MPRVLALDAGFTLGFGALGGGKSVSSGSRRLNGTAKTLGVAGRHCDSVVRELILQERPAVIAFATPFVGQIYDKKSKRFLPVQPDSIRPLMSFLTIIEMICEELRIRCIEVSEPEARRAFLTAVPRKSKQIKLAVQRGCRERGWPFRDEHAADSLCIAARALELLFPEEALQIMPLFTAVYPADGDSVRVVATAVIPRKKKKRK